MKWYAALWRCLGLRRERAVELLVHTFRTKIQKERAVSPYGELPPPPLLQVQSQRRSPGQVPWRLLRPGLVVGNPCGQA